MDKEILKKIEELAAAAEWHLKRIDKAIEEFTEGRNILKEITTLLEDVKRIEYSIIDQKMDEFKEEIKFIVSNPHPEQRVFEYLKEKLYSDEWPLAVPYDEICETEREKEIRASNILDFFNLNLEGKKFLDFGCGEGYVAKEALKQNCNLSVGYDINHKFKFKSDGKLVISSSEEEIKSLGPFDYILLYDVLDHTENPVETLKFIKSLMNEENRSFIYIRFHPWISRHGNHLYKNGINKAFVHLIFNEKELSELKIKTNDENKLFISDPEKEYDQIIKSCGFEIVEKKSRIKPVESFFKNSILIQNTIRENLAIMNKVYYPTKLEIEWVDYVLSNQKKPTIELNDRTELSKI